MICFLLLHAVSEAGKNETRLGCDLFWSPRLRSLQHERDAHHHVRTRARTQTGLHFQTAHDDGSLQSGLSPSGHRRSGQQRLLAAGAGIHCRQLAGRQPTASQRCLKSHHCLFSLFIITSLLYIRVPTTFSFKVMIKPTLVHRIVNKQLAIKQTNDTQMAPLLTTDESSEMTDDEQSGGSRKMLLSVSGHLWTTY